MLQLLVMLADDRFEHKKSVYMLCLVTLLTLVPVIFLLNKAKNATRKRTHWVIEFLRDPTAHQNLILPALARYGNAPFIMPTSGLVGFIWKDVIRPWHIHQGVDIFSGTEAGKTPVHSSHDGYLTRLEGWKSAVIIRIPADPLKPDRQIWTYYAHMADASGHSLVSADFPPGTSEAFVSVGTLLGFQGNYSGREGDPTGVHLHLSIVKDDGEGSFLNELKVRNTFDPSPYFGLALNSTAHKGGQIFCTQSCFVV